MEALDIQVVFVGEQTHPCAEALKTLEGTYNICYQWTGKPSCPEYPTLRLYPIEEGMEPLQEEKGDVPACLHVGLIATDEQSLMQQALTAGLEQVLMPAQWPLLPTLLERHIQRLRIGQQHSESCERFVAQSADPIFRYNDTGITCANAALLLLLGYASVEVFKTLPLNAVIAVDDLPDASEMPCMCPHVRLYKEGGAIMRVDLHPLPIRTVGGMQYYWKAVPSQGSSTSLEAYTHEQAALLVQYADQVPDVIYQLRLTRDDQIFFPFVSDNLAELTAIPLDELRKNGNLMFQYMHPEDIKPFVETGTISRLTLKAWRLDYRILAKDGKSYTWVRGSSKPVRLPDDSVVWYGYLQNITEEKKAQDALCDSEERVRTLFEHAPDAIAILDRKGKVAHWNPMAERLFGWSEEEIIEQPLYKAIGPKRAWEDYRRCLETHQEEGRGLTLDEPLELQAVNKRGREFTIKMAMSSMTIKNEPYFSCFMSDITNQKLAQKALEGSLREKEVLLKEIHHRVKNNLQVITSLLSLQASFIDNPFITDIFKKSQYRINSMGMVHEMLYQSQNLSKINYGEYLHRLVTGLIRAMKGDHAQIQFDLTVPDVFLNIDTAIPLSLIINEAVTNSLKYGFPKGEQGRIYIELRPQTYPQFMLYLGDDGVGYSTQETIQKGASLGLSLMRRLAVQLRGGIRRTTISKGTHYELQFEEVTQ